MLLTLGMSLTTLMGGAFWFQKLFSRSILITDCLILLLSITILPLLPSSITKIIWPITSTFVGLFVCKYHLFEKIENITNRKGYLVELTVILFLMFTSFLIKFYLWNLNAWGRFDGFYAFMIILAITLMYKYIPNIIVKTIRGIGSLGMFYWFIHSIFVVGNREFLNVLYWPYFPPLITIWGIVLVTIPVLVTNTISEKIFVWSKRMIDKIF